LEQGEFYAKALEEYRALLNALPQGPAASKDGESPALSRPNIRFALGRLLLIADPESEEGINELTLAVTDGFSGAGELEKLTEDSRISDARKDEIRRLIYNINTAKEDAEKPEEENAETEGLSGEAPEDGAEGGGTAAAGGS
jgi:hypothetical protein